MPEPSNLQSVVDAAEQAAGAGDFAAAAQLLQQAVRQQEAELGPIHPDLANTLNNLGVVCERIGNWTEAERSYRRAHTIAATALPADHPFVATSHQNLIDFCALRGLPLDPSAPAVGAPASRGMPQDFTTERQPFVEAAPASAPASAPKTPAPPTPPMRPIPAHPPPVAAPPPRAEAAKSSSFRGLAIAALVAIGALVVIVAIGPWSRPAESGGNPPPAPVAAPADNPAPPPAPAPQSTPSAPQPAPLPPPQPETGPARSAAAAAPTRASKPSTPSTEASAPTVVTAQLCRTLRTGGAEWTCTPAGEEVTPGPLYFYTRLKSPADTVVRHRWYRGDQLRQAGDLKVGANVSPGYRIYSRHTVSRGAANWRVELMTADGRLLHEERFVVK